MSSSRELNIPSIIKVTEGCFGLGKFIALDTQQQEDLLKVADMVINYIKKININKKKSIRPLNIYLEAPPGSGKSFLVKQIVYTMGRYLHKKIKIKYLNYNLTYMEISDKLLEAYEDVRTANLEREAKVPIVFFDEVDSKFANGKDSYPYFLSPMFDGKVFDKGKEFPLGPAVFFFAASKTMDQIVGFRGVKRRKKINYQEWVKIAKKNKDESIKKIRNYQNVKEKEVYKNIIAEKLLDFHDRIDEYVYLPPPYVRPQPSGKENLQATIIATTMLMENFPNVKYIEKTALSLLANEVFFSESRRKVGSVLYNAEIPKSIFFRLQDLPKKFVYKNKEFLIKLFFEKVLKLFDSYINNKKIKKINRIKQKTILGFLKKALEDFTPIFIKTIINNKNNKNKMQLEYFMETVKKGISGLTPVEKEMIKIIPKRLEWKDIKNIANEVFENIKNQFVKNAGENIFKEFSEDEIEDSKIVKKYFIKLPMEDEL